MRMNTVLDIKIRTRGAVHNEKYTSHRGDSGMKNRPGIRIRQGKIPGK